MNMATKIIKPAAVFSRPREIRVLSQEDKLAHPVSLLEKRKTKALSLCIANACLQAQCWYRSLVAVTEMIASIFFHLHSSTRR